MDWRLGWLTPAEIADALAETTVAVFPYRAEIDQSGALLQALGAGVPGVVYDVGGLGEVVRGSARDGSSRRATSRLWRPRSASCSTTRPRSRRPARAPRRRAGADLGRGGGRASRRLRGAPVIRLRRRRFAELVDRQLDLFAADEATLLEEAREAEEAWTRAGREDAEEAFGDWQLIADAIAERLLDLRETYAATLH